MYIVFHYTQMLAEEGTAKINTALNYYCALAYSYLKIHLKDWSSTYKSLWALLHFGAVFALINTGCILGIYQTMWKL